jgi:hypothetical protein
MALTEKTQQQVTVLDDGQLQVRDTRIIMDGGTQIAKTYHREVIDVGADVSNKTQRIQDIATAIHTPSAIAARASYLASIEEG